MHHPDRVPGHFLPINSRSAYSLRDSRFSRNRQNGCVSTIIGCFAAFRGTRNFAHFFLRLSPLFSVPSVLNDFEFSQKGRESLNTEDTEKRGENQILTWTCFHGNPRKHAHSASAVAACCAIFAWHRRNAHRWRKNWSLLVYFPKLS